MTISVQMKEAFGIYRRIIIYYRRFGATVQSLQEGAEKGSISEFLANSSWLTVTYSLCAFFDFFLTFLHSTAVLYTHSCIVGLLCRRCGPTYMFLVVVESDYSNCAKVYEMQCNWLLPVAEHVASNLSVKIAKRVVTHGPPNAVVLDFQSSLYRVSSSQSHFCIPTFMTVNLFSQVFSASSHNAGLYLLQTLRASVNRYRRFTSVEGLYAFCSLLAFRASR